MKFFGKVKSLNSTSQGLKYAVIEIENSVHLNYRLFVPGESFVIGNEICVEISVVPHQKAKQKQVKVDMAKAESKAIEILGKSFEAKDYPKQKEETNATQ